LKKIISRIPIIYRALNQTSDQVTLAFTPYLRLSPGFFGFSNDIPLDISLEDPQWQKILAGSEYQFESSAGASLTLPLWKFFMALNLDLGGSFIWGDLVTEDGAIQQGALLPAFNLKLLLGYSGERVGFGYWFTNINHFGFLATQGTDLNYGIQYTNIQGGVYFAIRF